MSEDVKTLLVVDDEEAVRELLARFLEMDRYHVLVAASGQEAVQISQAHAGHIDLLVTDVSMTRINGRQLAERLLQDRPQLRVLFISGCVSDPVLREGIAQGRLAFLAKPFTRQELVGKVRRMLERDPTQIEAGGSLPLE